MQEILHWPVIFPAFTEADKIPCGSSQDLRGQNVSKQFVRAAADTVKNTQCTKEKKSSTDKDPHNYHDFNCLLHPIYTGLTTLEPGAPFPATQRSDVAGGRDTPNLRFDDGVGGCGAQADEYSEVVRPVMEKPPDGSKREKKYFSRGEDGSDVRLVAETLDMSPWVLTGLQLSAMERKETFMRRETGCEERWFEGKPKRMKAPWPGTSGVVILARTRGCLGKRAPVKWMFEAFLQASSHLAPHCLRLIHLGTWEPVPNPTFHVPPIRLYPSIPRAEHFFALVFKEVLKILTYMAGRRDS
ncbi:hypothetical protein B0H13DRAFT_1905882 [Mycena leptocephala]|nr:hypothetical protein B0H13DRAFT_1905882 [Mycena leptocephala]